MNRNRKTSSILICMLVIACILMVVGKNAKADFVFGQAQNSGPIINTYRHEIEPVPEPLLLWFARRNSTNEWEEWTVSRATENDSWENPVNLGPWDESDWNLIKSTPSHTTADGLELYFYASDERKPDGYGRYDIWMKKRENIEDDWGPAINLGLIVNNQYDQALPAVSPDGLELYYSGWDVDAGPGGYGESDLWVTRRDTRDDQWGEPENLGPNVNSAYFDARPILVADGLLLFFESERPGGFGRSDMYLMRRATTSDPWSEPMNMGPNVNGTAYDEQAFLSPDGSTVYFHSNRTGGYGGYDIWQASVEPVIDFNGDGIVNSVDMSIMIDHWGEKYSLCDIGPTPIGDGIVDVQDLIVLSEYLFEEVRDPALVSYWPFDESEGDIAHDSGGDNDAVVIGSPTWLPSGGMVNGALELDGINDHVAAPLVLDLIPEQLSVFAWIKGGAPGQVIFSPANGRKWLSAKIATGVLMTELIPGLTVKSLSSDAVITDDEWHHVGLTWDGFSKLVLYVDAVKVVENTQSGIPTSSGDLYIGTGKTLESGTYWSGLIDDVRIYSRTLSFEQIQVLAK